MRACDFFVAILLFAFFASLNVAQAKSFPTLPSAFQTQVEVNALSLNSTFGIVEYYDRANNIERHDMLINGTFVSEILNFKTHTKYTMVDTNKDGAFTGSQDSCTRELITNRTKVFGTMSLNGHYRHVQKPSLFFHFKAKSEAYAGVETVRGITCDKWIRSGNMTTVFMGAELVVFFTVEHYFAVPQWHGLGGEHSRSSIPVRTIALTQMTTLVNSSTYVPVGKPVSMVYEFVNFWEGTPHTSLFDTGDLACTGAHSVQSSKVSCARAR